MAKIFNTTGACNPEKHYMVDISSKLVQIKQLVDDGCYFTINRARQYGKTTTIQALKPYLSEDYIVISLDFQRIGNSKFSTEHSFVQAFSKYLLRTVKAGSSVFDDLGIAAIEELVSSSAKDENFALDDMFPLLSQMCADSRNKIVLIIDEVDSATNNQVFLDFLAQLRSDYLERNFVSTFHSVILAGVYDVKNIKRKIRDDNEHKVNSPWNIATDFNIDMSFSKNEICGMLNEYEEDYHTGMDTNNIAQMIYDSTSGYPFLVSRICQLIDRDIAGTEMFPDKMSAWTREGFLEAEKKLVREDNTLFKSLTGKLTDYPYLKDLLSAILFEGKTISYVFSNPSIEIAAMLGFVKNSDNFLAVSNRIFEMVLYNHFLSEEELNNAVYSSALSEKNIFIKGGRLDMRLVLERFVAAFSELYKDEKDKFKEEIGRKYFMLFLKPIINGTGHSYVESRTRDMKRTDIIVDYHGEQFIIELKIWKGEKYHSDGEKQIAEYLDFYELKKGYMLTFNFTKNKKIGVAEKKFGDCVLIEATV